MSSIMNFNFYDKRNTQQKRKRSDCMKDNGNKRYDLLIDTIERYESFRYVDRSLSISWCCDSIAWLWKWRKISEEEKDSLCDRMIAIMQM